MEQLAILGLGLMGGSLGLAARAGLPGCTVRAFARRQATRDACTSLGAADIVCESVEQAAGPADVAVVCVPILSTAALAERAAAAMRPGAVITDVGSTKTYLERTITAALADSGVHYVGSHPIAGSDMAGIDASRQDLYVGATVVVTPGEAPEKAVSEVVELWRGLGAVPVVMSAEDHDRILAKTSHLPHVVSAALVQSVLAEDAGMGCFCGSGFRDATRIAAGSADVWHDILRTNASAVSRELRGVGETLAELADQLERGELERVRELLAESQVLRTTWGKADANG